MNLKYVIRAYKKGDKQAHTFFDETNTMRVFETAEAAFQWIQTSNPPKDYLYTVRKVDVRVFNLKKAS